MKLRILAALLPLALAGAGAAWGEQPAAAPLRLSLADAIAQALDEGTAARLATARIAEAQAAAQEARSALQPQLSAGSLLANESINLATFGFTPPPGEPNVTEPFNVVDFHVTVAMNVIDLAARRRYRAAQAGVQVSEEERRRIANDVAAAVASLYVAVGRSSARIDEIRANVDLFERLRQLAVDQKQAGVGTRLDTTRAEVQLARQRQALLVATNQRDVARLALLRAIGADLGSEVVLADDWSREMVAVPPLAEALTAARQGRPELAVIEQRLRAADLTLAAARAEKFPTLGTQAQGIESGNRASDLEWSRTIGAMVTVPLFTGRRTEARVAAARSQQAQLLIERQDAERQIEQEVRQAVLAVENAHSRVDLANQNVRLAEDELEQASDRFKAGVAPSIEVDNAQTSLAAARDLRVDALADEAQARFDLARATGQIRALIPEPNATRNARQGEEAR
ncbi:MAG TPA: TolC family protein [Thermoanaerobaculia bacterium]|jgi:outer membrane protein TolC|nr:TolC family protein [Thermoanaerobaculia bacterium]